MVGAIVLYVIAVGTGLAGVSMWASSGDSDSKAIQGMVLCIIATIALSAALIIDGVRHYATKLSTQLGYTLKPGSVFANSASPGSPGSPSAPIVPTPSHRSFQIVGRDQRTGRDTEMLVSATDETEALRAGEKRGLDVKRVALAQ
jgi:hypothetical protein